MALRSQLPAGREGDQVRLSLGRMGRSGCQSGRTRGHDQVHKLNCSIRAQRMCSYGWACVGLGSVPGPPCKRCPDEVGWVLEEYSEALIDRSFQATEQEGEQRARRSVRLGLSSSRGVGLQQVAGTVPLHSWVPAVSLTPCWGFYLSTRTLML